MAGTRSTYVYLADDDEEAQVQLRQRRCTPSSDQSLARGTFGLIVGIFTGIGALIANDGEFKSHEEAIMYAALPLAAMSAVNVLGSIPLQLQQAPAGPQRTVSIQEAQEEKSPCCPAAIRECANETVECLKDTACNTLPPMVGWGLGIGVGEVLQEFGIFNRDNRGYTQTALLAATVADVVQGFTALCGRS